MIASLRFDGILQSRVGVTELWKTPWLPDKVSLYAIDLLYRIVHRLPIFAEESMAKLVPGGRLALYSGAPIVNGHDVLLECLRPVLQLYASHFVYEEIDPDVFGEELDKPAYAHVDRIAAVGLTATKQG